MLLLLDGDHLAAFPEGDHQRGEDVLSSAACRRGKTMEQSHGPFVNQSHALPLHCRHRPRRSRSVWECSAGV